MMKYPTEYVIKGKRDLIVHKIEQSDDSPFILQIELLGKPENSIPIEYDQLDELIDIIQEFKKRRVF